MILYMTKAMAETLTAFLNRKRGERMAATKRGYSIREMADEIHLHERTLGRLMDEKAKVGGIEPETFQALFNAFGDEFLIAWGVDPNAVPTFKVNPG